MENTNIELTKEGRQKQYYIPYAKAKYASMLKENQQLKNLVNQTTNEVEDIHSVTGSILARVIADFVVYPASILSILFIRFRDHVSRKAYEARLDDPDTFEYDYKLDRFIRRIDRYTKNHLNFELFRSSTKPDYLTRLRQKTEEMNNTQLSYEDELGI